jgi:hypothetical protein
MADILSLDQWEIENKAILGKAQICQVFGASRGGV